MRTATQSCICKSCRSQIVVKVTTMGPHEGEALGTLKPSDLTSLIGDAGWNHEHHLCPHCLAFPEDSPPPEAA